MLNSSALPSFVRRLIVRSARGSGSPPLATPSLTGQASRPKDEPNVTGDQASELVSRLLMFRPTDCALIVNGAEVQRREPVLVHSALLE